MDLRIEIAKVVDDINELHSAVSEQNWSSASRVSFIDFLYKAIGSVNGLNEGFKKIDNELKSGKEVGAPKLDELLFEIKQTLKVFENNRKMESEKRSKAKESNLFEKEENSELYSALSERVQSLLLKMRYNAERVQVFAVKQGMTPLDSKSTAKQVMDLLRSKESEIEELRGKYEDVRKKSFLGYVQEETSVDLEQELAKLSMQMGTMSSELQREINQHRKQLEYIENNYAGLKENLENTEEIFNSYMEKSIELTTMLKKERDYAKNVVLDVEHETLKLRNTYSNEILSLQENKLKAKKEAEDKFEKELLEVKKRLREKDDLMIHFRKIAEEKSKREKELDEKIKELTVLVRTKQKHEAVKRHFKERTGKKK